MRFVIYQDALKLYLYTFQNFFVDSSVSEG
jgi:hypothetical protein